nr:hypothetical protein [Tanacetum cinerariifolium]
MRETFACCKGPYDLSYAAPISIEVVRIRYSFPRSSQNRRDLPRDIPLVSVEVHRSCPHYTTMDQKNILVLAVITIISAAVGGQARANAQTKSLLQIVTPPITSPSNVTVAKTPTLAPTTSLATSPTMALVHTPTLPVLPSNAPVSAPTISVPKPVSSPTAVVPALMPRKKKIKGKKHIAPVPAPLKAIGSNRTQEKKEDQKEEREKKQRLLFLVVAQEHRTCSSDLKKDLETPKGRAASPAPIVAPGTSLETPSPGPSDVVASDEVAF